MPVDQKNKTWVADRLRELADDIENSGEELLDMEFEITTLPSHPREGEILTLVEVTTRTKT